MPIEIWDLAAADDAVRFSPFCWRIHLALAHKGLSSKTHPWRFTDKDVIAFSGQGLVPVIRDGETVVSDSWTIAGYLDEAYPDRPRLIDGPQALALTSFVRQWAQVTLSPIIMRTIMPELFAAVAEKDKAYFRESREQRLGRRIEEIRTPIETAKADMKAALHPMRLTLAGQPFLCGATPAFADYIVMGAFMWARCISRLDLLDADDPVHAWRERMLDLFDGLARRAPRANT